MARLIATVVLGLMGLAITPPCFGQTSSAQGRDRRLANETEIGLLKRLIKEQDRRIGELEKTIKSLQVATASDSEKVTPHEVAKTVLKPVPRWQNPLGWSQIREGLSRTQVEEILGKPASVESVLDYQTLIYKSDLSEAGSLTGTIKLTDDRVSAINPPNF